MGKWLKPSELSFSSYKMGIIVPCKGDANGKELSYQCRGRKRRGFSPWVFRPPGERYDIPLQYFCLGNHMDRGAWQAIQSIGLKRVRYNQGNLAHMHTHRLQDAHNRLNNNSSTHKNLHEYQHPIFRNLPRTRSSLPAKGCARHFARIISFDLHNNLAL